MKFLLLAPIIFGLGFASCDAQVLGTSRGAPRWKQVFSQADKNGDGVITLDEAERPQVFRKMDKNGDGRVTAAEAGAAMQAHRGGPPVEPPPGDTSKAPASPYQKHLKASPYQKHLNLPYAEKPGVDPNLLSLDIYTPGTMPEKAGRPVVVMVHGGGWRAGDKANDSNGTEKAAFFTAQNCVYVSVNYRLSPAVRHPAHAEDVARAVAWVFNQIGQFGGDPNRLTLMGHSAGAHLAALVATDRKYLAKLGKSPTAFHGVILLDTAGYNIVRNLEEMAKGPKTKALYLNAFGSEKRVWLDASPITHVRVGQKLPRFLVFHTARKSSSTQSKEFVEAVRQSGSSAFDVLAEGKTHASLNRDIGQPGDGPSRLILEFLAGASAFPASI